MTQAQVAFAANMKRPAAFLAIFDAPGGQPRTSGRPSDREKELLRAAVVFAVAALDAYLHDVVLEVVVGRSVISDALAEPLRAIAKDDPALALRVALAPSDEDRRAQFRAALGDWLSTKSFQGPEAVARALGFVGRSMSSAALEDCLGTGWATDLSKWTNMRHGMVHRAETPYVRRQHAGECVDLITRIVQAIDRKISEPDEVASGVTA